MIKIDRISIEDVGGNPTRLAEAIIKQIPNICGPVPVRDIAYSLEISEIREESLDGIEGALVTFANKSTGSILVHSERSEERKRYTIAHELGHYVNPWHTPHTSAGFRCRSSDMRVDRFRPFDRAAKMETEANEFAADLLMPTTLVKSFLRQRSDADIKHIFALADRFGVSKEAAARRYVAIMDEPTAVVFSKDGLVRYIKLSKDFPRLAVWSRDRLPMGCSSIENRPEVGRISEWNEVEEDIWIERIKGCTILEQTVAQQNGYQTTLLTFDEAYEDLEEDDDGWEPPQFRR